VTILRLLPYNGTTLRGALLMTRLGIDRFFIAAVALTVFAVAPLFHPGYPAVRSGLLPIYELFSLMSQGRDLSASASGAWSQVSLAKSSLVVLLRTLGLGPFEAIKSFFLLSFLSSAVTMYLFARFCYSRWLSIAPARSAIINGENGGHQFLESRLQPVSTTMPVEKADDRHGLVVSTASWGALLAVALYVYAPYHLASTYILGDLREALVFPFLPLAGWFVTKGLSVRRWQSIGWWIAGMLTIGICWWGISGVGRATDHLPEAPAKFLNLQRLLSPVWSTGPPPEAGAPVQVGAMMLVLAMVAGSAVLADRWRTGRVGWAALSLVASAVALVLLMLPASSFLWGFLTVFVETPPRLLSILALVLSLLGGTVVVLLAVSLSQDADGISKRREASPDALSPNLGMREDARSFRSRPEVRPLALALTVLAVAASYNYLSPTFLEARNPGRFLNARFGPAIVLLDYDLETPMRIDGRYAVRAGEKLRLTLVWQSLAPVAEDLTVFTHLIDSTGKVCAQKDNQPMHGQRPTSGWQPGESFYDPYEVSISSDVPPGEYELEVGLYNGVTGQRQEVSIGGNHDSRILLDKVTVFK